MVHLNFFIMDFMSRYNYPDSAAAEFTRLSGRLDEDWDFGEKFDEIRENYLNNKETELSSSIEKIEKLADIYNENRYTLDFVFILSMTEELKNYYEKQGISEDIYYDTMDDMRCKLLECMECEGVPGTFVGGWFDGFFRMKRFALGRFQYELTETENENVCGKKLDCGFEIKKGMRAVNFHIPSSGIPLTDKVRYASYRKAYDFFRELFPDGRVLFTCESWLLSPLHREFLPENSNILKFMDDFTVLFSTERDEFGSAWRVFGKYARLPLKEWPVDTALRKAYVKRLEEGKKVPGHGEGFFLFDGENIIK